MRRPQHSGNTTSFLCIGALLVVAAFAFTSSPAAPKLGALAPHVTPASMRMITRITGCAPRVMRDHMRTKMYRDAARFTAVRAEGDAPEAAQPTELAAEEAADAAPSGISLASLEVGTEYEGTVRSVVSFGAFLDIGAEKDGLLHVSEFGESGYVADASKFMKPGQKVQVKIKSVDLNSQKLALGGTKEVAARISLSDLSVGSQVDGVIRKVASFGAFVDVGAEKDGLLHISQLDGGFVEKIEDVLKEGQTVNVRVAGVDLDNGKITLSMRKEGQGKRQARPKQDLSAYVGKSFDDKFEGEVTGIESYGAFVQLADGIRGLMPISFMAEGRVEKVQDVMNIGDTISMAVLEANPETGKVSFTIVDPATKQRDKKEGGAKGGGSGRSGDWSMYEEYTQNHVNGAVAGQSVPTYEEKPYLTAMGGAFAQAGIQITDKAKSVMKERVETTYADHFANLKAMKANQAEAEKAAVAAAAAAEAEAAAAAVAAEAAAAAETEAAAATEEPAAEEAAES